MTYQKSPSTESGQSDKNSNIRNIGFIVKRASLANTGGNLLTFVTRGELSFFVFIVLPAAMTLIFSPVATAVAGGG